MKRLAFVLTLFSLPLLGIAKDGSNRIGYVDLQQAMQMVDSGKKAKSRFEKDVSEKKKEIEKRQQSLQKEAEDFEKRAAIMNEKARSEKQAELQKKFVEYQKFAQETQMELQKKERELTEPILKELRSIVEAIGKEKKFQLIVEKNQGAVLYAEEGSDLTEEVVDRFNRKSGTKDKS